MGEAWVEVSRATPCPICGKSDWCSVSTDGRWAVCRRVDTGTGRHKVDRAGVDYWIYAIDGRKAEATVEPEPVEPVAPRAEPDDLHRVYGALLEALPLSEAHRDNLRRRGLPDSEVDRRGYRTLPPPRERGPVVRQLLRHFGPKLLEHVPGFVKKRRGKGLSWNLAGAPGLLVPVRNVAGRIVALKVRVDDPADGPKYCYVSSKALGGPGPGAPVHVPLFEGSTELIRITEGELKADVATVLSGVLTISVPGVSAWRAALPVLQALKARHLLVAFDADARGKVPVARALLSTAEALARQGYEVEWETWPDEHGKGVDDVLAAGHAPQRLAGSAMWQALADLAARLGIEPSASVRARAVLVSLPEQLRANPGAAYRPETLEALAVLRKTDPAAWEQARQALRRAGVSLRRLQEAQRERQRTHLRLVEPGGDSEATRVGEQLPDAPLPNLVVPEGYRLTRRATWKWVERRRGEEEEAGWVVIAQAPILITARLIDVDEGLEYLQLAYRRQDGWHEIVADRAQVLTARRIVELASEGLPVSSVSAAEVVGFLERFEAENFDCLPRQPVTSHLGWQGGEREAGFLWGRTLITVEGPIGPANEGLANEGSSIVFRALAPGDAQIAEGFHACGTLAAWVDILQRLCAYPVALIGVYASCAPPLLRILGAPNFALDFAFRTSSGKTSVLRLAASVWGRPDEKTPDAAMGTWDATKVWVERAGAVLHDLPLILDDTKRAKSPEIVAEVLYLVASGRGRGRGNPRSLSRIGTWRTILISSGEAKAISFTQDGGTRARTLEITVPPFGAEDPAAGQLVDEVNAEVMLHYGHAGPLVVQHLLRHRAEWPKLQQAYTELVRQYAAHQSAVLRRLAQYLATIEVAAAVLHSALEEAGYPLSWKPLAFEPVWQRIWMEAEDAPPEVRALRDVMSWAYAHAEAFLGRHQSSEDGPKPPPGGWAGKWAADPHWQEIAFWPTVLRDVLRRLGYEPDAILASWRARGWLETGDDRRRYEKKVRLDGEAVWMVVLRRQAVEEAGA